MKPLCFVLMPFGIKTDGNKKEMDFDQVYQSFIKPAILKAGLEPIRADEEKTGGFIHKPMYERLMFCDFAIADLSFANANVFYELGIRHALKPYTTVSIFDMSTKIPFDTSPLRTFPYNYEDGEVKDLENQINSLSDKIKYNLTAQKVEDDSPIGQLIQGYQFPDLKYLQVNADAFAQEIQTISSVKGSLTQLVIDWKALEKTKKAATELAKNEITQKQHDIVEEIFSIEEQQGDSLKYNYDLVYSLLDTYKAVNAFKNITTLLKPLLVSTFKSNIYLKQQAALACNKIKDREGARQILESIIDQYGPDPETNGLLGAVLKGFMDDNIADPDLAEAYRSQAVEAYLKGFESDPRDYYPGVNALTLLFFSNDKDERFDKFYPLVSYAVERMQPLKARDYWVQATALELAVLKADSQKAIKYLSSALTCSPEKWMKKTTFENLQKIYNKFLNETDESKLVWLKQILDKLQVED